MIMNHLYKNEIMMIEDFNIDQNRSVSNIERSAGQDPLDIMNTDGKTDIASIVNENLEK